MSQLSSRLSLTFSCIGHATMHLFAAFYFIIVLALEKAWQLPYHELIELWTLPAILIGLCALPAGWLSDKWHAPGMITVMFLGLGVSGIICSLAQDTETMLLGLCGIGLFAAIYHPVGIPWVIRNAEKQGKALGINGIFGSLGVALASIVAGALIEFNGWQAAFWAPSTLSIAIGLAMSYAIATKKLVDHPHDDTKPQENHTARNRMQAFAILAFTMLSVGIIFNAIQTALPKVFELRLPEWIADNTLGIGGLVSVVYGTAAFMQLVGGYLADKYPLKRVYMTGLFLLAVSLALSAQTHSLVLALIILFAVFLNAAILPAENMLVAHFTPQKFHGIAYGLKFVITFGAAPLSVLIVAKVVEITSAFVWLFFILMGIAFIAGLATLWVPEAAKDSIPPQELAPEPQQAS